MKHFLYISLFLLAFGFTACEKETYDYASAPSLTPEERFDRMEKPLILYQFAQRQLESGQESGWLIDREGWVRTYHKAYTPGSVPSSDQAVLAQLELEYLYGEASEGIFQIEKAELAEYLLQSVGLNQNQLSDRTTQEGAPLSQAFFAYAQKTTHVSAGQSGGGGCNNGGNDYIQVTQIYRSVVDLQGPESRYNTSAKGQAIHTWLLAIQEELNSKLDQ
ncbi:hypothetical protein [Flavilitoribacter nigricans]|uniref:Uncharacterized protein n=1 Tax=Flavilitoribacter nigricans (strain ATCC 23147 / DSM 23189 / NBRC 102662 / NCIMB 1420 / SS-2) TaxID=1122177 RepID=A0A2D0N5W1_FLAN2|nr:hypothetical protein [Flavilitoribacter nigricans]PHN03837.1 hypothetical protein CRP01_25155 [Flavilitoribacter nigricans DSM 23189 = NBRC 102662]